MTRKPIQTKTAKRLRTNADIVFCVDSTGSMDPCFDGLRENLSLFADGLQVAGDVNYRVRLIGYRDVHDARCGVTWVHTDFTSDLTEFKKAVGALSATGGGGPEESTLDALYLALTQSKWRPKCHKTIVLMTDADTHPTLHSSTYARPDNDVERVIQAFQTLRHVLLYLVAPRYPIYERIAKAARDAERKIIVKWVSTEGDYTGLKSIDWTQLMTIVGQMVSQTSVAAGAQVAE